MKYIIIKSVLGFGDRLEVLQMCVKYALENNIKIYIDWSDTTWSSDKESFLKYFSLNIPMIESLDEIPDDASVFPPFWKGKLKDSLTKEILQQYGKEIDVGFLTNNNILEDVMVCSSNGRRNIYLDYGFFYSRFKVIDSRIIQEVKRRQQVYTLSNKWGIHLRGADRASNLNYKEKRVSELTVSLVHNGLFNGAKIVVVSDDPEYIQIWKRRFPEHPVITSVLVNSGRQGTHNMQNTDVTKDSLNVELLIDFFTLASCKTVFSSSMDSRFAKGAQRVHPYINQIIG